MDEERRKRMAERLGTQNRGSFPKYEVPTLRIDGNLGSYKVARRNDEGSWDSTEVKAPQIVILKVRSSLAGDAPARDESYYSSEYNTPSDTIAVFHKTLAGVKFIASGPVTEMRAQFPTLRMRAILYVLYNKEVHKMEVKGGSIGNWFNYQRALGDKKLHSFEVITVLGAEEKMNDTVHKKYYAMTFADKAIPASANVDTIESKQIEVEEALTKIDSYGASLRAGPVKSAEDAAVDDQWAEMTKDTIQYPEEEINPDDIPF